MKSLSLSKPHLIIMVGVPGSGRTFFAEKFAETFRAPYVSREKIVTTLGQDTDKIDSLAYNQLEELLKTQQSVIVEGLSDSRAERLELARKARANNYESLIVWVQTDPTTAKNRYIKEAKQKQIKVSSEDYEKIVKRFAPPLAIEKPVVISGKHTYATQAKVVLKKLSTPRAQISTHPTPPVRTEPAGGRRNITIR
jgi:predicted kinase